jgi:hypothetical protein
VNYDLPPKVIERPYFLVTITEECFKQNTHVRLPCSYRSQLHTELEPSGHYLKPIQVVGYKDGIAILQANCSGLNQKTSMDFVVVHMKTETVISVHSEPVATRHYLCDCIISPDLSSFVLKPNAMYVLNFCRGEYRNAMQVISCRGNHVGTLLEGSAVRSFVAYDPRFKSRRIAIGNYLKNGRDITCLYDLEDEKVVLECLSSQYQTTHNIAFSADGIYLASLILGRSVKDGLFNFPRVLIYNTADLSVAHVIRTSNLAEVPTLSPSALFPVFSDTGRHLAIACGEQGTFYQQVAAVHVYKVPLQLDLQSLCRLIIREHFDNQDVERLPLPSKLKAYLRFQPHYG